MSINFERIRAIEASCADLDPLEAYYRKRTLDYETIGPLVPSTRALLRQALQGMNRVLDIGCGDGESLLSCREPFNLGVGYDESEYALNVAR